MQSKLPVRINKKHVLEKNECHCSKIFQSLLKHSGERSSNVCICQEFPFNEMIQNNKKKTQSKSTQRSFIEPTAQHQAESFAEIKEVLLCINSTLETILLILKDRKEYLYGKLNDTNVPKPKKSKEQNKNEKSKNNQLARTQPYRWPEISRLYSGSPLWIKKFAQKQVATNITCQDAKLFVCPIRQNVLYSDKPISCPNINYFQRVGQMLDDKILSVSMYSFPILALASQTDLENECYKEKEQK